jgi:hypothetical protein
MKRILSHPIAALAAGAALRFFLVLHYPAGSGDTGLYEQIAVNWLKQHVYGMNIDGLITPVDTRMPGYPAFLALIYWLSGKTGAEARLQVMSAQVLVDVLTCLVTAGMAAVLFALAFETNGENSTPRHRPRQVFSMALWLAALCPFTANYVAVLLTETWATFFTALTLLFLCLLVLRLRTATLAGKSSPLYLRFRPAWFGAWAGLCAGLGTLFRPETPLVLVAAALVLGWHFVRGRQWLLAVKIFAGMAVGCVLPLLPWAARNAVTLHEAQFLSPKNSTLPGELIPYGFMAWEKTWLYRVRDSYLVTWKLNDEAIHLDDLPALAFDTSEEKDRVAEVLGRYNNDVSWTADKDLAFGELAAQRTARHPLRTYLWIPAARVFAMWLTPRIELLPFSGNVFPLAAAWEYDRVDQFFTITWTLLNVFYLLIAAAGAWCLWRQPSAGLIVTLLLVVIALRTAFLTTQEAPEPRYVLECFPILLAFAAQIFVRKRAA